MVIGITTGGEILPMGGWAGTSWDAINKQWKANEMKFPNGSRVKIGMFGYIRRWQK